MCLHVLVCLRVYSFVHVFFYWFAGLFACVRVGVFAYICYTPVCVLVFTCLSVC